MKTRFSKLLEFLSLDHLVNGLNSHEVRSDSLCWTRFSGSLLIVLTLLLFLSGTFMALYYSPVPGIAYDSVDYAFFTLPFGIIIKGIHHYSWNLMLIVMILHLCRSMIFGSYKARGQMTWVTGVIVLLFIPLFIITGDLLPWDQKGYWSTQVRLSIISSIPWAGPMAKSLLLGSSMTGVVALTRFYVLHILILPGFLIFLLATHFHFIYQRGLSEPLSKLSTKKSKPSSKKPETIPFFPDLMNRWFFLFIITTLILGAVSWYWTPPFGDPADPTDTSYIPQPEWWVLFLNQMVSIFRGSLAVLGSTVIPAMLAGLLVALPFIDSSSEKHPTRRWKILLPAALIFLIIIILSIMGYTEHFVHSNQDI